jgi:hypothetical protein
MAGMAFRIPPLLWLILLSAACASATPFARVDEFPSGLQIATFTSAWMNRLHPSQVSRTFAVPYPQVWHTAKTVAQRLAARLAKVESLIDEGAGSIRITDEQQIQEPPSDADSGLRRPGRSRLSGWKDEFLIQVTAVSSTETRVLVSRTVLGMPRFRYCFHVAAMCELGKYEPEISNGQIENWVLTQITDELARAAAPTTQPSKNPLSQTGRALDTIIRGFATCRSLAGDTTFYICTQCAGTIAMDREEAKKLREAWSKLGDPECQRRIFELETDEEYMTGSYVCTQCGKRTQLQDADG